MSNNLNNPHISTEHAISFTVIWRILWRHRYLISLTIFFFSLFGAYFSFVTTPLYSSEAVIQFDMREEQLVDIKGVLMGMSADEAAIESELDVLKSREMATNVAKELNLANYPEFNPTIAKPGIIEKLLSFSEKGKLGPEQIENIAKVKVVDNIVNKRAIIRTPNTYTVKIKFTSTSAKLAAKIPNSYINQYDKYQINKQTSAISDANEWLDKRVEELKEKVSISEQTVQKFREENNLIEIGITGAGETVQDKQIAALNAQLSVAGTDRVQAEAKVEQAKELLKYEGDSAADIISEVLDSLIIQSLREKETTLLLEQSDLHNRYGGKHPKMIKLTAEISDLREKIKNEVDKVVKRLENELRISKLKESNLKKQLKKLTSKLGKSAKARVQLAELEREMQANIGLYEAFLNRYKETSQAQNKTDNDILIISEAGVPIEPSWPNKGLLVILFFICGTITALLVVTAIEIRDTGFRNPEQAEHQLGRPVIGLIPELNTQDLKERRPSMYVINEPLSAYAESLRSIMTNMHFSNEKKPPKAVMVTSSVPNEGKSVFCLSLARVLAKSGKKVLLVDADMRRPTLHEAFSYEMPKGLREVLTEDISIEEVIHEDTCSGAHLIRSSRNTLDSRELLISDAMKNFINKARKKYDHVIIDTPPVMALSDASALLRHVDGAIFLVKWRGTRRKVVHMAMKRFLSGNSMFGGIVFSRVNMRRFERGGYGEEGSYYSEYDHYYSDSGKNGIS